MLQTFFTDTIESKFIKELLLKTPLPIFPTKKDGDFIVKDFYYIYGESIIKCLNSGYIKTLPEVGGNESLALYDEIDDYVFGNDYLNITQNHISKYNYYDTDTHERLGDFLRAYRDIYNIDLMPYYNCFSYKGISGIEFENTPDKNETYNEFDIVSYKNKYYVSKKDNNLFSPDVSEYWEEYSNEDIKEYSNYDEFNILWVPWNTLYYVSKTGINTTLPPSLGDNWAGGGGYIPNYYERTYQKYEACCIQNDNLYELYVSKIDNNNSQIVQEESTEDWYYDGTYMNGHFTQWQANPNMPFSKYDLVSYGGTLYSSKTVVNTASILDGDYWHTNDIRPPKTCHEIVGLVSNQYKLICAPIRFNTTYTISIECPSQVVMMPIFYDDSGIIQEYMPNKNENVILHKEWCESKSKSFSMTRFKHPVTFSVDMLGLKDDDPESEPDVENSYKIAQSLESIMYLVIQLPINNSSSILIQEGDYTNLPMIIDGKCNTVYSIDGMTPIGLNKALQSQISLQRISTGTSYAFSNRLIEYLLKNVIDSSEQIGENIEKSQRVVEMPNSKFSVGVWNDLLRISLYNEFIRKVTDDKNKRVEFADVNGFVDKDTEYLLKIEE